MNDEMLLELAALKACGRHSWVEIGRHLGMTAQAARGRWRRNCRDIEPGPCPLCDEPGAKAAARSSWQEQGNYAEGTVRHEGDPLSLDEFLGLLRVDTDVWRVRDWKASRWQSPINRQGHLDFDEGVIDGSLDYFPGVQDLWSHRATFVRREPVAVRPVVQPVECHVTYHQPIPEPPGFFSLHSALICGDLHIGYSRDNATGKLVPFHDRGAISVLFSIAPLFDRIIIAGDLLDLTNWNDRFLRSPDFYYTTQPAVLEAHWLLARLRALNPEATIIVIPGNHEKRIGKALQKHLIEAYGLRAADEMDLPPVMSPERLLALHKLGIEWAEAGETWLGPLRISHGEIARKAPGASTRAVVEDSQCDEAFGHTHRLEMVSKVVRIRTGSKVVRALSTGCLCHTDGRVPGSTAADNWHKGFVTIHYSDESWTPSLIAYDDLSARAIVGNEMYWGVDYTQMLRQDLPDWNW